MVSIARDLGHDFVVDKHDGAAAVERAVRLVVGGADREVCSALCSVSGESLEQGVAGCREGAVSSDEV